MPRILDDNQFFNWKIENLIIEASLIKKSKLSSILFLQNTNAVSLEKGCYLGQEFLMGARNLENYKIIRFIKKSKKWISNINNFDDSSSQKEDILDIFVKKEDGFYGDIFNDKVEKVGSIICFNSINNRMLCAIKSSKLNGKNIIYANQN